jgi:hypothetical protein
LSQAGRTGHRKESTVATTFTPGQALNFIPVAPWPGATATTPFYYGLFVRYQDGGVVVDGGRGERWVTADSVEPA